MNELFDAMNVTVPEGQSGDVSIRRFHVDAEAARFSALRAAVHGGGRAVREGTYTGLYRRGGLWMSDTPAERYDHLDFVWRVRREADEHVVVSGLGLGMVVAALLTLPHVQRVDVTEIDEDVIRLVGDHVRALAKDQGKTVEIAHGDAYTPTAVWGSHCRWDAAWHDIWQDISGDDYEDHKRIRRAYGRRVCWQDVWQADTVRRLARSGR